MDDDIWTGLRFIVGGLIDAAKKASYCLGFGVGGLGVSFVLLSKLGVVGSPALLISLSFFFILARLGKTLDSYPRQLRKPVKGRREISPMAEHELRRMEIRLAELERRLGK
jgi:hypothetical protein